MSCDSGILPKNNRALDSRTRTTTSTRFSHRTTQTNVILAGITWYRRHFSTRFCKNVVESKQVKKTVVVLPFFDLQKVSVTSNKNNLAIYTAKKK